MRPYRTYNCKYRTCRIWKQERVKQTDSEKGACVDEKAHNKLHIEYNGRPKNYKRYFKRAWFVALRYDTETGTVMSVRIFVYFKQNNNSLH